MSLSALTVVGLNHRTTPIEQRGLFSIDRTALPQALQSLHDAGVQEAVILSTCNRTEIYAFTESEEPLLRLLEERSSLSRAEVQGVTCVKRGMDAARQLYRVVSGLDSAVIGESEILGQVKRAWISAQEHGSTGAFLNPLFQRAITVGKSVRSNTGLGTHVVSIASLAMRLVSEQITDLTAARVMVVGTGDMASRMLRELADHRPGELIVAGRNREQAERLAAESGATALSLYEISAALTGVDVIFTATSSPQPVVTLDDMEALQQVRSYPLTLVDLGVPRNIDPEIRRVPTATLFDMDDLQALSNAHHRARQLEIPAAEQIIERELAELIEWATQRTAAPVIASMKEQAEELRLSMLGWAAHRLGCLPEEQMEVVDLLTRRLVKHLLRYPISELRNCAGDAEAMSMVSRMIGMSALRPACCSTDSERQDTVA
jgi:glutamyl-tRNA reductase